MSTKFVVFTYDRYRHPVDLQSTRFDLSRVGPKLDVKPGKFVQCIDKGYCRPVFLGEKESVFFDIPK